MRVVLANGCFDPLHYGHVLHLRAARELGTRLVVALTSDDSVRREKGAERPFYPWEHRAEMLRELRCVSDVVLSVDGVDAILKVKPDIFVKGIDYSDGSVSKVVTAACKCVGAEIIYTRTPKLSSTTIVRRLRARAA